MAMRGPRGIGLVGESSAAEELNPQDETPDDDAGDPQPQPRVRIQPPRRPPIAQPSIVGNGVNLAARCVQLLRSLEPGHELHVERIRAPGPLSYLCAITCEGPLRFPDDLVSALRDAGHTATGVLELTAVDANGQYIDRTMTPALSDGGRSPARDASPMGATSSTPLYVPPAPSSDALTQLISSSQATTAEVIKAMAGALRPPQTQGLAELLDSRLKPLADRIAELESSLDDDDDEPAPAATVPNPASAIGELMSLVGTLEKSGFVTKNASGGLQVSDPQSAMWSAIGSFAPGLTGLIQQAIHEIGEVKRMHLAWQAAKDGVTLSQAPAPSSPPLPPASPPTNTGNGQGG